MAASQSGVLSGDQIRSRIADDRPLLTGWIDLDQQTQPNGFDLTLAEIQRYEGKGSLGVTNAQRKLPALAPVPFDDEEMADLDPGIYHITYNEVVSLPGDLMALGRPRSSLNRSGVTIHTAVWDAGYSGRSTSLLAVLNPAGFRIQRNARIMQLVFIGLSEESPDLYRGIYQGENVT